MGWKSLAGVLRLNKWNLAKNWNGKVKWGWNKMYKVKCHCGERGEYIKWDTNLAIFSIRWCQNLQCTGRRNTWPVPSSFPSPSAAAGDRLCESQHARFGYRAVKSQNASNVCFEDELTFSKKRETMGLNGGVPHMCWRPKLGGHLRWRDAPSGRGPMCTRGTPVRAPASCLKNFKLVAKGGFGPVWEWALNRQHRRQTKMILMCNNSKLRPRPKRPHKVAVRSSLSDRGGNTSRPASFRSSIGIDGNTSMLHFFFNLKVFIKE